MEERDIEKYKVGRDLLSGLDVPKGAKFNINVPRAIAEFEMALRRFPVKRILYNLLFRGKGLEFDSYRQFDSSDDADMIDWKASLRANSLLAKKYVEERDLSVYFLVDVSGSMLFGSRDRLKAEYAAEVVCALSHLIVTSGDRIGLVMFSDKVVKLLHPVNSRNQFALFVKYLSDPSLYGGGFDLKGAIDTVLSYVKTPYTVFVLVSDFIKMREDSTRLLRLIGTQFETFSIMMRDELDENLPRTKYQFALQDPYSRRQMILDPEIAVERYRAAVVRQKGAVKDALKKSGIDILELMTNKSFAAPTVSFLKARANKGGRV
jgi:uncharacterized protein (DUF58 family)